MGTGERTSVLVVEHGDGLWGAQRYLVRLAPLLAERGVDWVLAHPKVSATAEEWERLGLRHLTLDVPNIRSVRAQSGRLSLTKALREGGRMIGNAFRTARLARRNSIDVIHANSHWSHLECALAGKIARIPVQLHLHEQSEADVIGRLRALAVRLADSSIAVSNDVRDSLPERARARVTVVPNGIDADEIQPGPADPELRAQMSAHPDRPIVLSASRLDPRKGVQFIIEAVSKLPPALAGVALAIAGSGELDPDFTRHLKELAAELLPGTAIFLGYRTDVIDLYRSADVMVMASDLEGMPLGVLEAQATKLPVVAWPAAGIPEMIEDGVNGFIVPHGDVEGLTDRIAQVLTDDALRERIVEAGRASVIAEHSLAVQADTQAEILHALT
jgi:glycosyltransferase involved in cell wall biosynthesis